MPQLLHFRGSNSHGEFYILLCDITMIGDMLMPTETVAYAQAIFNSQLGRRHYLGKTRLFSITRLSLNWRLRCICHEFLLSMVRMAPGRGELLTVDCDMKYAYFIFSVVESVSWLAREWMWQECIKFALWTVYVRVQSPNFLISTPHRNLIYCNHHDFGRIISAICSAMDLNLHIKSACIWRNSMLSMTGNRHFSHPPHPPPLPPPTPPPTPRPPSPPYSSSFSTSALYALHLHIQFTCSFTSIVLCRIGLI